MGRILDKERMRLSFKISILLRDLSRVLIELVHRLFIVQRGVSTCKEEDLRES